MVSFEVWFYSIISVVIISLISLVGMFTISIKIEKLKKFLLFFVSFSVGALFGDAFIHLMPEAIGENGVGYQLFIPLISGILVFFILEKFIHWRHCHVPTSKQHPHPFAIMNLVGDSMHNLIDGLVIGGTYLASIPLGIATTLAVILHEIPQEIGDFGVLIHGGFSRAKALFFNFLTALTALLGVLISLAIGDNPAYLMFLIPFTAGGFIYIAGSDLIPELHKESAQISKSVIQFIGILLGLGVMILLLQLE